MALRWKWNLTAASILLLISRISSFSLNEISTNGCYGNGDANRDFLTPDCVAGEMMSIEYIRTGAKKGITGCPLEATIEPASHKDTCCSYDETEDKYCFNDYTKNQTYFAEICLGRSQCLSIDAKLRVDRVQTTGGICDTEYLHYTNYMVMSYYCAPDIARIEEDQSTSATSKSAYLHSKGYPASTMKQRLSKQIGVCSISGSACNTRIRISLLDIRFTGTPGSCSQTLTINDGPNAREISCDQNSLFVNKDIYTSTSNFLTLDIENPTTGGIFFLEFDSVDGSDITLGCGGSALTSSPTTGCDTTTIDPTESASASGASGASGAHGASTSTSSTTTEKPFEMTKEGYMVMAYVFLAFFMLVLIHYIALLLVFMCYIQGWRPFAEWNTSSGMKAGIASQPNGMPPNSSSGKHNGIPNGMPPNSSSGKHNGILNGALPTGSTVRPAGTVNDYNAPLPQLRGVHVMPIPASFPPAGEVTNGYPTSAFVNEDENNRRRHKKKKKSTFRYQDVSNEVSPPHRSHDRAVDGIQFFRDDDEIPRVVDV